MAVFDGGRLGAVYQRGNACSKLMAAKDAAFHLEVADGGTVEPDERGA